jgi:hypothetical protein
MGLEDLLARFKPRESSIPPTSEPAAISVPGGSPFDAQPAGPERPEVPKVFKDNFSSTSPAMSFEPQVQHQQQPYPQFAPAPQEDRLSRIEEKLKLISDKIDLMSQQVSVVWEMQRRKMQ